MVKEVNDIKKKLDNIEFLLKLHIENCEKKGKKLINKKREQNLFQGEKKGEFEDVDDDDVYE